MDTGDSSVDSNVGRAEEGATKSESPPRIVKDHQVGLRTLPLGQTGLSREKVSLNQTPTTHSRISHQFSTPGNVRSPSGAPALILFDSGTVLSGASPMRHHHPEDAPELFESSKRVENVEAVLSRPEACDRGAGGNADSSDEFRPQPKIETGYFASRQAPDVDALFSGEVTPVVGVAMAESAWRLEGRGEPQSTPKISPDLQDRVCTLSGERIEAAEGLFSDVTYWKTERKPISGYLIFTNYKMVFFDAVQSKFYEEVIIPYGFIENVSKIGRQQSKYVKGHYGIEVHCGDVRPTAMFTFVPVDHPRRAIVRVLKRKTFVCSHLEFFAFQSTERYACQLRDDCILEDYTRMGFPNDRWRITCANDEYGISCSLARFLIVPAYVEDDQLLRAKSFRSCGRIPVVSWIHPETKAVIVRASQPAVGLMGSRNLDDEALVQAIIDCNPSSYKMAIMDARPEINALFNRAMGAGFEDCTGDVYSNCELEFMSIANMHAVRSSYESMKGICLNMSTNGTGAREWWTQVRTSSWFSHLSSILNGVRQIVNRVTVDRKSVLVHCSDGWDRTPQLVSLAMLMMDKHYRTIEGFYMLIEKEWLQLGHRFGTRCGNGIGSDEDERSPYLNRRDLSPVFVQFLDCTFQLLTVFPTAFEFTEYLLQTMAHHAYSRRFGTFLMDTQKEREDIRTRTSPCFWTYAATKARKFINAKYIERDDNLTLKCRPSDMKLWTGHFMKRRTVPKGSAKKCDVLEGNLSNLFFGA